MSPNSKARSLVPATQLQAFDRITNLATNDPHIRELLQECMDYQTSHKSLSYSTLREADTLASSSRKALISLSANAVTNVTLQYESLSRAGNLNGQFVRDAFVPTMAKFLWNPEASFLVVRSLKYVENMIPFEMQSSFKNLDLALIDLALQNSDVIEWASFDDYISSRLNRDYLHAFIGPILPRYVSLKS